MQMMQNKKKKKNTAPPTTTLNKEGSKHRGMHWLKNLKIPEFQQLSQIFLKKTKKHSICHFFLT